MTESPSSDRVVLSIRQGRPSIRGSCSLATSEEIARWLRSFEDDALEVDLSGVTSFDSHALRLLLDTRLDRRRFRIVNPSPPVAQVLNITGTHAYLVHGTRSFDPCLRPLG